MNRKHELHGASIILKNARRRVSRERKIELLMYLYEITAGEATAKLNEMEAN